MLPDRSTAAENAFVAEWMSSQDTDGLIVAIETAMDGRRPRLAARLVGLLDQHIEIPEGSALHRAQKAAKLLLHTKKDSAAAAFIDAWRLARRSKIQRIKNRMRRSLHGDARRVSRTGRTKRR